MFTIIGGDGKEYGPVSAEQVRSWLAAGRANLDTKAKAVGSNDWRRLGDLPEFNPSAPLASPPPMTASVTDAKAFAAEVNARSRPLDVFGCIGQGFDLWKNNFLPLVGVTLGVLFAVVMAGMIPLLGMLSGILLNGVFYGGLYYYYLGRLRGEPRDFGDAFAGFSKAFVPLMLATLFTSLILIGVVIVCLFPLMGVIFKMGLAGAHSSGQIPQLGPITLAGMFVGFAVLMYLTIGWAFAFMLVIDQGMTAWTAMEVSRRVVSKHWFRIFFLMLLSGLMVMLGLIVIIVGVVFTLPLGFTGIICAYERLFHPAPANSL
jgi:hypothetical protein